MHKLPLALLLGSLFLAGCEGPTAASPAEKKGARPPVTVVIAHVEQAEVTPQITLVGTVMPARRSIVGSAVDGRVVEINIEAGDSVSMTTEGDRTVGEPIAQLLTQTISIEIAAAEAVLERLRQRLRELEAGSRPEEITQAEARWEAAKATQAYAQSRYTRLESLYQQNRTVSQEDYEASQSAALSAQQNLLAAAAAYELVKKGSREEVIAQARAEVVGQEQEVLRLEDMRNKYTLRSPFKGYVVQKQTEVGAWLSRGDPVAEIVELDPIDVEVQVPESLVAQLVIGDTVPVTVDALPPSVQNLEGVVHRIVPSADLRARTFPVKIRLKNPETENGTLLKAGMLARATLSGRPYQALLVPKDAIVLGGEMPYVMTVASSEDGSLVATRVSIQQGVSMGTMIEVQGELQPGQEIIVRGNERVQPGQPLQVAVASSDS